MNQRNAFDSLRFLMMSISMLILGVLFLVIPGVERWRAIPAFALAGIFCWMVMGRNNRDQQNTSDDSQRPLPDDEHTEKISALAESDRVTRLAEEEYIHILNVRRKIVPLVPHWQAALDRLVSHVTLLNTFADDAEATIALQAEFQGTLFHIQACYYHLSERDTNWEASDAGGEYCIELGIAQTDIRGWVCLLYLAASLADIVNGVIADDDELSEHVVSSDALVQRARTPVNAGFPESQSARMHWSGPETAID